MRFQAIRNVHPNVVSLYDEREAKDKDGNIVTLDQTSVDTEVARLQAEWDAQEYARNRQVAYPNIEDFIEAYTEKEIGGDSAKWDAYVIKYNTVRSDNPKP